MALYQTLTKDEKWQPVLIKEFPSFEEISGKIHSAVAYDGQKYLFLFDEANMYIIDRS